MITTTEEIVVRIMEQGGSVVDAARAAGAKQNVAQRIAIRRGYSAHLARVVDFRTVRRYTCPRCGKLVNVSPCVVCAATRRADPGLRVVDRTGNAASGQATLTETDIRKILESDRPEPRSERREPVNLAPIDLDPWALFPNLMQEVEDRRTRLAPEPELPEKAAG